MYFGLKGFVNSFIVNIILWYFSAFDLNTQQLSILSVSIMFPWSLKTLISFLSDFYPLGGYHKRYYLSCIGVLGIIGCFGIIFLVIILL
eukprot:UN25876